METNLPTPMTARVEVLIYQRNTMIKHQFMGLWWSFWMTNFILEHQLDAGKITIW